VTGTPSERFLARLEQVRARLRELSERPPASGLTEPDQPSGEQWEWGQVWAHLGEFVPFWVGEVRTVLSTAPTQTPPMGRTKTDQGRVGAIEADRGRPPSELMSRLDGHLDDLRTLLQEMSPERWARRMVHPTLRVMSMERAFEEFLLGHLEQHADQLDGLVRQSG
jgi:hypothetical protein